MNALTRRFVENGKDRVGMIGELEDAVARFPQLPNLKNNLHVAYSVAERIADADELLDEILRLHPDYLIGKVMELNRLFELGCLEEIPGRFAPTVLELTSLAGGRTEFHPSEGVAWFCFLGRYYASLNNLAAVKHCLSMVEGLSGAKPAVGILERLIANLELKHLLGRLLDEEEPSPIFES